MENVVISDTITIPDRELRESFARSGGPGGQNVNKVETKAELRWNPAESTALSDFDRQWLVHRLAKRLTSEGDLLITSSRTRDQSRNREDARAKLAEAVRKALQRPKRRKKTRPPAGSVQSRLNEKKRRSDAKDKRQSPDSSHDW